MSKTVIISNRLPISVKKNEEGELQYIPSAGGLATGLGSIYKSGDNIWLGWPGFNVEDDQKVEVTKALTKESMRPVFLTDEDIEMYYEGFSNSILWPLFHYFPQFCEYRQDYWEVYKSVNQKFCDAVLEYAEDGDVIWVHDYQLLLLPQMIREKLPNATIGYFNHIPFPSYEMFRNLPWRESTLNGLLGADMIAFHTYDDMRHFLSAVSRITGMDHEMGHLRIDGRLVTVDALPMGIDYKKFSEAALSKETHKEIKTFYGAMHSQKMILSIDRLDYSKGIPQRLKAFEQFLEENQEWQGKVSLILLVVPSRDKVASYKELKEELDLLVGRINGKYGMMDWTPIHYFYRSLPFNKLSALYSMSDIALVTPLRDGMNLVCKEYVASKLDKTGVLILSEMAGAAKEMSEAIIINPNDPFEIVDAIKEALTMSEEEQVQRNEELQTKLKRYDVNNWVENFMKRLMETKEAQKENMMRKLNATSKKDLIDNYKKSDRNLLLLDYDGTLTGFHVNPLDARPDEELHEIIRGLAANPKNAVVIISGRDRHTLQEWFGEYDIEFVAEHGVWSKVRGEEWKMREGMVMDWKEEVRPILELYVDRTPGAMIEEKDYSLVWHFRKVDEEFGSLRSRELISNLQFITGNMDIQILEGNKVIEIKNSGVNKGNAAMRWLNLEDWGFVFAVGDDHTDEDTFHVMPESAYSLKVGMAATEAKYNISSVEDVRSILKGML